VLPKNVDLFAIIQARAANPAENSYTNYLINKGLDKICKKIGEESAEVIIAAKNSCPKEIINEIADLTYHLLVLMHECGISPDDIADELTQRSRRDLPPERK